MRPTLARAKASSIPQAVNLAACDERFTALLNEAQERLAAAGKWWGTYRRIRVCVFEGCVTWPEDVLTVEGILACGEGVPLRNEWYEFLQEMRAPSTSDDGCSERELLERGTAPQFRGAPSLFKVRLYAGHASDAGKRVLVQGLDSNGQPIRTLDPTDGWVTGEYLTLVAPPAYVESSSTFKGPLLTGVQKPITNTRVTATSVDAVTGAQAQIGVWSPSVTAPEYRRTFLVNRPRACEDPACRDDGDGCLPAATACPGVTVDAMVRLRFIPAVADSDWLFIGSLPAIKEEMRAIQMEEANQPALAEQFHQRAIRHLRQQLEANSPAERASVGVSVFGVARPARVFGGFN